MATAPATSAAAATAGVFLTAAWRWLVMLNYEVDPAALAPLVPRGTVLDDWRGRTYASVVGFRFLDTRVLGVPIPFHRDFDEINLRFYVRRDDVPDAPRRGVVFVKEIVPRRAIAALARALYNENYVCRPMRHRIGDDGGFEYAWREGGGAGGAPRWNRIVARVEGEPAALADGSEEEFVTEHYWGYATQRDGGCVEYRVQHPRWRVWRAADSSLECDVRAVYGEPFAAALARPPVSAFVAEGSPVIVRRGVRLC